MTVNSSIPGIPGSLTMALAAPKGSVLIEQFVPGSFASDAMEILPEVGEIELVSQSPTLIVLGGDRTGFGYVEARFTGAGLNAVVDGLGDLALSGTVTGMEILSDGIPWVKFSGFDEVFADFIDIFDSATIFGIDQFIAALWDYDVTWDGSAAGGAVTWDGHPHVRGVTLIGGDQNDNITALEGDTVFPGTNPYYDYIHFTGGDISVDLSAAASNSLSYYDFTLYGDENYVWFDQGVVANIGLTGGTIEYGNTAARGTVTVSGVDALTELGGFSLITGIEDDVVSVQGHADLYFNFISYGGANSFTGGLQFDRLSLRDPGGITHQVDGYGAGGAFGTSVDGYGDVTTFSAVDQFYGSIGDDVFFGGNGDDIFITERGNDTIFAGDAFDFVRYNRSGLTGIDVDLAAGTASGIWYDESFTDTLYDVEYIRGTIYADLLSGSAADERLDGMDGADIIDGRFGADLLVGGAGADIIRMGGVDDNSADGAADVASGFLETLHGDTIKQIGAEDAIAVVGAFLTDAQVRLVDGVLSIDGDNNGSFETEIFVSGPALTGAAPVLTHHFDVPVPGSSELYSGTEISFAPDLNTPSLLVTTTDDVVDLTDGETSLREAMEWVNNGTLTGTITFAHGAGDAFENGGTILLNGTELLLTRADIAIDGDLDGDGAPDVTLDAGGLSRVLHIAPAGAGTTVISGLTITGGMAVNGDGGGVMVVGDADVRFFDTDFTNNAVTGGGDEDGRGGGIFVDGGIGAAYVELNGGAILGNAAYIGGGMAIVDGGQVTAVGTLIADNFATSSGGGVIVDTDNAKDFTSAKAYFYNTTIANNIALEAAGGFAGGRNTFIDLINSTVTGNDAPFAAAGAVVDDTVLSDIEDGLPPPETVESGVLGIGLSIIAGNGADPADEIVIHDPTKLFIAGSILAGKPFDLLTETPVDVPDFTITLPDGTTRTLSTTILSDDPGLDLADIFDAIDPATGGGQLAMNGGRHETAALKASFSNPAIDVALIDDFASFGDDLSPESLPYALLDANGAPRAIAFLDPTGPELVDIGAVEAVRQPLPDAFGPLPGGAPVLADLSGGGFGPSGDAAAFDGAAFTGFGVDDSLMFADASNASQFSFAGNMLTFDADGDADPEAQVFIGLAPEAADLIFTQTGGGVLVTAAPAPAPKAIGEVVHLTVGTTWQTLNFANTYEDAVVFALAPTLNEAEAAATRFRNVTGDSAEIRLQEPKKSFTGESNPGDHLDETVTLVVLEKGVHALEDGTVIQVGELETNKLYVKGFESIEFTRNFDTTPSIFSQVQTFNGTDFIISRQRNPDDTGFQLTMQEEEADNLNHATETVGWFAIEHGGGSLSTMDWLAGSSAQNVNGNLTPVHFGQKFDEKPLVMAGLASYNGTDTSSPRIGDVYKNAFTAKALEDQSADEETFHGHEIIDWMAFTNEGTIFSGELVPTIGAHKIAVSGFASTGNHAITVDIGSAFDNPVVIATMTSRNGTQEAVARVSNVTSTSFDVHIQETDALDGNHGIEDISWIVVEAGSWTLDDGTIIQAGLEDVGTTTRQGFSSINFDASFDANPAVLTQTQTDNDAAFVKTRMKAVDGTGFEVALEEEEAASWGSHGTETVGWLAVDMGLASDADGFVFEAGDTYTNHNWKAETFTGSFEGTAGLVAGMATFNANDTAATRIKALTDTGFDIHVEEDTSLNPETGHGNETFHWIAFDGEGVLWGDALLM